MDLFKEFNQPWKFDSNEERKREELVLVDSLREGEEGVSREERNWNASFSPIKCGHWHDMA